MISSYRLIKVIKSLNQKQKRKTVQAKTTPKMTHKEQFNMHAYTENMNMIRQNENRASDKHKCNSKTQKHEL